MARFLIEIPHEPKKEECALAAKVLRNSGSHYLTNADFGCFDEEHKAWIIVEVESKEEARLIIPPVYRSQAKIIELNKFSLEDIEELLGQHQQ
jgi:hypothetical protein